MTGHCGNCGEHVDRCSLERCNVELTRQQQIVCLPLHRGTSHIYLHFCSTAHLTDFIHAWTKKRAHVTTVTEPGGVAVHE